MTDTTIPDWAYGVRRLVVFSGAGFSTDSGIADFRGPNGAWTKDPGARHRNTYQAFMVDHDLRAAYWRSRINSEAWTAEPNISHHAVSSLLDSDIDLTVITQNTDGLHQRGGMPADRVLELHGTMHVTECVSCGQLCPTTEVLTRIHAGEAVPPCAQCGGILKTASTMFGQTMSTDVFAKSTEAVTSCDLILAVGTSLVIEPAGSLCATAVQAGANLVIVNLGDTPYDSIATEIIREPLGEALPRIVAQLRAGAFGERRSTGDAYEVIEDVPAVRPTSLLAATRHTARLQGRAAALDRLAAWCAGSDKRTHLVWGPSWVGKTRLALELADRVKGQYEVHWQAPGAELPAGSRPMLVIVDDADVRGAALRAILDDRPAMRVLLLARTAGGWWDRLRSANDTDEELAPPNLTRGGHADTLRDAAADYAAALEGLGVQSFQPDRVFRMVHADVPPLPGVQQASVLADMLGITGSAGDDLARQELAHLLVLGRHTGAPAETLRIAILTVLLCGARDEESAVAVLEHIPALADDDLRSIVASWLHEVFPPTDGGDTYWDDSMPGPVVEDLIAANLSTKTLINMFTDTTEDQERRALTVLARASATRPVLRERLSELLSVLPGFSPSAVEVALHTGYPKPMAEALIALTRTAALPADLLEAVPPGTTILGEFPVLLAASLVEAYEHRATSYPDTALPWLAGMQAEYADRLLDLGRIEEGMGTARMALANAERLTDRPEHLVRAVKVLRRADDLSNAVNKTPSWEGRTSA